VSRNKKQKKWNFLKKIMKIELQAAFSKEENKNFCVTSILAEWSMLSFKMIGCIFAFKK
jgi:hypothetical protein